MNLQCLTLAPVTRQPQTTSTPSWVSTKRSGVLPRISQADTSKLGAQASPQCTGVPVPPSHRLACPPPGQGSPSLLFLSYRWGSLDCVFFTYFSSTTGSKFSDTRFPSAGVRALVSVQLMNGRTDGWTNWQEQDCRIKKWLLSECAEVLWYLSVEGLYKLHPQSGKTWNTPTSLGIILNIRKSCVFLRTQRTAGFRDSAKVFNNKQRHTAQGSVRRQRF